MVEVHIEAGHQRRDRPTGKIEYTDDVGRYFNIDGLAVFGLTGDRTGGASHACSATYALHATKERN